MQDRREPLISVIIPVYNAEAYLPQCYASLRAQEHQNLELIFVNDGSKDGSLAMLRGFAQQDPRVVIIDQHNQGVSAARNAGLDRCTGEYIGFCDADDRCAPTMFSNMLDALLQENADIACCGVWTISMSGKKMALYVCDQPIVMGPEEALRDWLMDRYVGNSIYSKLTKRNLWDGVRFPKNEIFEEAEVIPKLFTAAEKIVHTATTEYYYIAHEGSITARPADDRLYAVHKREKFIREYVLEKFPGLEDAVTTFEINNNMNLMMSAELSRATVDAKLYRTIQEEFDRVFWQGLKSKHLTLKSKIHLIELKTKVFYLRKRLFKKKG